jgi:hypothetical protein
MYERQLRENRENHTLRRDATGLLRSTIAHAKSGREEPRSMLA